MHTENDKATDFFSDVDDATGRDRISAVRCLEDGSIEFRIIDHTHNQEGRPTFVSITPQAAISFANQIICLTKENN